MSEIKADAYVHLRVPAEKKARWVRESRASGMRLTDWVIEIIEEYMLKTECKISPHPDNIRAARISVGITQMQAADLIHVDISTWQRWEMGDRKMHPAMWELFLIKTNKSDS